MEHTKDELIEEKVESNSLARGEKVIDKQRLWSLIDPHSSYRTPSTVIITVVEISLVLVRPFSSLLIQSVRDHHYLFLFLARFSKLLREKMSDGVVKWVAWEEQRVLFFCSEIKGELWADRAC